MLICFHISLLPFLYSNRIPGFELEHGFKRNRFSCNLVWPLDYFLISELPVKVPVTSFQNLLKIGNSYLLLAYFLRHPIIPDGYNEDLVSQVGFVMKVARISDDLRDTYQPQTAYIWNLYCRKRTLSYLFHYFWFSLTHSGL